MTKETASNYLDIPSHTLGEGNQQITTKTVIQKKARLRKLQAIT